MMQFYLPLFLLMHLLICLLLVQFLRWVLCHWLHLLFLLLPQKICNRWFQMRLILLSVSFRVMLIVRCFVCLVLLCIVRLILIVQSLRLI